MYNTSLVIMEITDTQHIEHAKLGAKYEKFIVFGYWLSERIKNTDNNHNSLEEVAHVFSDANQQVELLDAFFEDYKIIQRSYKKQIRDNIKASKPKPPSNEPEEQKKRGRKKKERVDNRTEEEKLLDEIIAKAQDV